jgi:hypothetical protein
MGGRRWADVGFFFLPSARPQFITAKKTLSIEDRVPLKLMKEDQNIKDFMINWIDVGLGTRHGTTTLNHHTIPGPGSFSLIYLFSYIGFILVSRSIGGLSDTPNLQNQSLVEEELCVELFVEDSKEFTLEAIV